MSRVGLDRGQFHKKNERGGAQPHVAGAGLTVICSFCSKEFASIRAVAQHEKMKHKKLLKILLSEKGREKKP